MKNLLLCFILMCVSISCMFLTACNRSSKVNGVITKTRLTNDPDLVISLRSDSGKLFTLTVTRDDDARELNNVLFPGMRVTSEYASGGGSAYTVKKSSSIEYFEQKAAEALAETPKVEPDNTPEMLHVALKRALDDNVALKVRILELEARIKELEAVKQTASKSFLERKPWDKK